MGINLALVGIEVFIALAASISLVLGKLDGRWAFAIFGLLVLLIVNIILGGYAAIPMATKVLFFSATISFAFQNPLQAKRLLIVVLVAGFVDQVLAGNLGSKLAAFPFLLSVSVLISLKAVGERRTLLVFALVVELLQAAFLEARGLLLLCVATLVALLRPQYALRLCRWGAILVPVIYPLLLTFALFGFLGGGALLAPTSSNLERSALAAWAVVEIPNFVLFGPGDALYHQAVSLLNQMIGGQGHEEFLDPHSFLLSAWVWLGSLAILFAHMMWTFFWISKLRRVRISAIGTAATPFLVMASVAILNYTLSPPDVYMRLVVALACGVALNGLSRSNTSKQSQKDAFS